MGYKTDIRAIDPKSSQLQAGISTVTTANGILKMPYYLIHACMEDAAGCPMTQWSKVNYYTAAVAPPLKGSAIRLLGRVSLGWVYGRFGPHNTRQHRQRNQHLLVSTSSRLSVDCLLTSAPSRPSCNVDTRAPKPSVRNTHSITQATTNMPSKYVSKSFVRDNGLHDPQRNHRPHREVAFGVQILMNSKEI